jgi:hypothetical protein
MNLSSLTDAAGASYDRPRRSARVHRAGARVGVGVLLACACLASSPPAARAAVPTTSAAVGQKTTSEPSGTSLESAAAKAGSTGRAVAMSLIGLAFAVAATVLAFRRDFKEAASVFAVGIVSVLLATPAGVSLLRATVTSLFGAT